VPRALAVESRSDGITIVMTKLRGRSGGSMMAAETRAVLSWLARMHAEFWGARADVAVREGGLQAQGCYWYLDTRSAITPAT
jgi:hypothetical protein